MTERSKNIPYLLIIDQLRGFAALLIVFYHGMHLIRYDLRNHRPFAFDDWPAGQSLTALIWEGHTAVALFMVLSGFIFTYGLMGRPINVRQFYTNRFLRTFPLFIVLVFVGISANPKAFSLAALLSSMAGFSYLPGGLDGLSYTGMFWSLGLEWQFYAFFPALYLTYCRLGVGWLVRLATLLVVFRLSTLGFGTDPRDVSYWTLLGRMDQFMVGMLAAHVWHHVTLSQQLVAWGRWLSPMVVLCSLAAFNAAGGWVNQSAWKLLWPCWEALMWATVLVTWGKGLGAIPGLLGRFLAWAGEISYSIYLLHFVVVSLIVKNALYIHTGQNIATDEFASVALVVLPATLALAHASFHCIERPFMQLRRKY